MANKSNVLTDFQKKKTAEWLLNISQASVVAGVGAIFIPEIGKKVGLIGAILSVLFALVLYILAMWVAREVKDND
ncbi:hypothetical protein HZA75_02230 [Candidatus Roizmanbacteria bacterium]|nr:hypothetical protein [Candidatus Roizmanbacteria bacterium]